ncbi:hypothetical protein N2152v2_008086 [Parachlorella kessleri]
MLPPRSGTVASKAGRQGPVSFLSQQRRPWRGVLGVPRASHSIEPASSSDAESECTTNSFQSSSTAFPAQKQKTLLLLPPDQHRQPTVPGGHGWKNHNGTRHTPRHHVYRADLLSSQEYWVPERVWPLIPSQAAGKAAGTAALLLEDTAGDASEQQQQQLKQQHQQQAVQQQHGNVAGPAKDSLEGILGRLGIKLSNRAMGLIAMNAAVLLYSTNWVIVKDSSTAFDPYAFSALRFSVAAAAFSPFLVSALRGSDRQRLLRAGLELGLFTAAGYLLQSQGLLTTDASRASFLSTFTVIIVPILVGLSGRGVAPLTWLAAVMALAGMSLLEGGGGSPPSLGDLLSFLSAVAFGVQVFRTEHWVRQLGPSQTLPLTALLLTVTMTCSLGVAAAVHPQAALGLLLDPVQGIQHVLPGGEAGVPWGAALYTGLLTTDACFLCEVVALSLISSSEAAVIFAMEPVLGAALAYAALGERWGPLGWAGAAVITASSLATQLWGGGGSEEGGEEGAEGGVSDEALVRPRKEKLTGAARRA